MATILKLPPYPSSQSRKSLSPTQLGNLYQIVAQSLQTCIGLDPQKRDQPSTKTYLSSYFRDAAFDTLQQLIWKPESTPNKQERLIRARTLELAERVAGSDSSLDIQTLLDIAIVQGKRNISRVRKLFKAAFESSPSLLEQVKTDMLPAISQLLSSSQSLGLYGIRKATYCIVCFLRALPGEGVKIFASDKDFVVSMAQIYDTGLSSIATSYGGFPTNAQDLDADGWESKYIQVKIDLIDSFHVLISRLLEDMATASGAALAIECDQAFHVLFALLDIPSSSQSASQTPFLDRSLLHDYQNSYDLAKLLESTISKAHADDARGQALQEALLSLHSASSEGSGVLRLLIRSSGAPPRTSTANGKKKAAANTANVAPSTPAPVADVEVDSMVAHVRDILPEHPAEYIRALLLLPDYPFYRNVEKLIEALLEETAPTPSEAQNISAQPVDVPSEPYERRNVFNEEAFDISRVHFGKKSENAQTVLDNKIFMEQNKADILRRVEELNMEEDEYLNAEMETKHPEAEVAYDEDDMPGRVTVNGDGETTDDEGVDEAEVLPETILELAYLRDQNLFARDGQTRKSKGRADLKAQTGLSDEQIEGWKIMLDRNPHKERILAKHEFSGNRRSPSNTVAQAESSGQPHRGEQSERGQRGYGRSRGRGRGQGGQGGGSDSARGRSSKERRGNQRRTRGHDKKMRGMGVM